MFELSFAQVQFIKTEVSRADVSLSHLPYDLIDHICCDIENTMNEGLPFEKAYEAVKKKIGIRGLQQIQEDTLFLIDKKYRIMKNTMKIFGVIAPILMAVGGLFKIEHWPGAGVMVTLGFFLLTFVFLPSAIYVSYREVSNKTKLFLHLSGFLAGFFFAVSFLFKIQHWPWASYIMFAAVIASIGFIPALFISQVKLAESNTKKIALILGLIGSLAYLTGFYFKIQHWPGASLISLGGDVLLLVIAFPMYMFAHYKNREIVSSRFIFILFAVVCIIVPTSLIKLTISGDIFESFRAIEKENIYQIQYLNSKNTKFLKLAQLKNKEIATNISNRSDAVFNYIQHTKAKIIGIAKGDTLNQNHEITEEDIKQVDIGDKNAGNLVLFEQGRAKQIKTMIVGFRQFIIKDIKPDSISLQLITKMLDTNIPPKKDEGDFNSWEEYHLKGRTLITTINNLSNIQKNVRTTEYICLQNLIKKSAQPQLLAKTQ
jgi:hypothetical protein